MPESVIAFFSVQSGDRISAWWVIAAGMGSVVLFQIMGGTLWRTLWQDKGSTSSLPILLVLFFQQVLGIGSAMLVLLGLALVGAFHALGLLGTCVAIALGAWWVMRRQAYRALAPSIGLDGPAGATGRDVELWEWGVLLMGMVVIGMAAWRLPGHWDDTAYHLPLARTIVEHHGLVANEWLRFPYFPAYAQLLFAAGLLLDVSLAQWLANWPMVVTLMGLMGAGCWLLGHSAWGVIAWLIYVRTPLVESILGFAYLDVLLALYCMAAVLAAMIWTQCDVRKGHMWILMAGLCAGIASGIKFQGLVVAAAVGVGVLVFSGANLQALRNIAKYGMACSTICIFWYVRSYWITGDPIHPAGGDVFGYYLWTQQDLLRQVAEQALHGVPKHWSNFLDGLLRVQAIFLCSALLTPLFGWGRRPPWLLMWLVITLLILFWFWISQVSRYLMPVLPLGALMALALISQLNVWINSTIKIIKTRNLLAVIASIFMFAYLGENGRVFSVQPTSHAQREGRSEIVLLEKAQELQAQYGRRVLNFGYENAYFFYNGQLIGDWFGPASFFEASDCEETCSIRSIQDVVQLMNRFGIQLVLIHSERFKFDEKRFSVDLNLIAKHGSGYLYALKKPAPSGFE